MKVAQLILKSRKKRGLSQNDLARLFDLKSAQFISNIERGLANIPIKYIPTLTSALHISEKELIDAMVEDYRLHIREELAKAK